MSKLNWWKTACAVSLLCTAAVVALPAQTFTTLHSFDYTNGANPFAGLMQATDGNLYGTTADGGANAGPNGGGTVFKVSPNGTLTTLYSFCSQSGCADGKYLEAGLVQAANRSFYGTTFWGGANDYGTVFQITPSGTLTTLYSFCPQSGCPKGANPNAGLMQATDGNFYGSTSGGASGYGTVFDITPTGSLTTLYSFDDADGYDPFAALVQGTDGNFYGTTAYGGANGDYGTVFKVTPTGTVTTLYSFCSQSGCTDGYSPVAGLVQGTDGNLYGTTVYGGANGLGTVFKITTSGTLTALYSFCSQSGCTDGSVPSGSLIQATDGNFYGTTSGGGLNGDYGTIFKITPSGMLTTLYNFCSQSGCVDGELSNAALLQDTNGKFYGTTVYGGNNNDGTVFGLSLGLGPFVETQPAGGKVGAAIKILGTNLTGATSVTFNGTPAAFTVEASSVIKATVPAGATTGTVQVVTPSGTLSSNVPFRVKP